MSGVPAGRRRAAAGLLGAALLLAPAAQPASAAPAPAVPAPAATDQQCTPDRVAYSTEQPQALARLSAERAWDTATGRGVLVAVVDSGVDARNEHLADAVLPGVDLVGVSGDPGGRTDTAGHGTAVAGQIAARPVDDSGVVGLAPDAEILPVRVYYADDDRAREEGVAPDAGRIAAGIEAAVAAGAQVVNVSMSTPTDTPALREAVARATAAGALVVASAGNRTTSSDETDGPRYPAAYDGALAVTAVDVDDAPSADAIHGEHVDVAAPGTNVLTTYHAAGDCLLSGENVSTSFATAYVSAAAALIAERYPDETPEQWAYRLEVTAARAQPGERDDLVGWGVVRPAEALGFVDDGTAVGPPSPVHGTDAAATPEARTVDVSPRTDPLAAARRGATWWGIAGTALVLLAALAGRVVGRRRRR
ncbi:S8 family serine peptidase [Cellulomonas sp. ES6]|uniref:S8 family serine peptidase n=1 Tax=Cellulomonas sp. ES6 TaxID=3039384 RepID=UPI0024B78308|nr:S8 family serine peptidase [Cellulomonas sp. ES6]WHP19151.1 S8 family serine peptidase [Cellulomonas sp. ES6]